MMSMKPEWRCRLGQLAASAVLLATCGSGLARADDPGTNVVTVQGRLVVDGGAPTSVAGQGYDFVFRLYASEAGNDPLGPPIACDDVPVEAGLFSVALELGSITDDLPRWLAIEVDIDPDEGTYIPVDLGRRLIGLVPKAEFAAFAANGPLRAGPKPDEGDYLFLDGAIGVGTSMPDVLLHVAGSEIRAARSDVDPGQHVAVGVLGAADGFANAVVSRSRENNAKPLVVRSEWTDPLVGDPSIFFEFGPAGGPYVTPLSIKRLGEVGINTANPIYPLDVAGRARIQDRVIIDTPVNSADDPSLLLTSGQGSLLRLVREDGGQTADWLLNVTQTGDDGLGFYNFEQLDYTMILTDDGEVGINTTNPSARLEVVGTVMATAFVPDPSDGRLKRDVRASPYGLAEVLELAPVTYRWRDGTDQATWLGDVEELGFVAQDVRPHVPHVVVQDERGMLRLDYDRLVPVLVSAVQEQQHTIDLQHARLEEQAARIADLEAAAAEHDELRERLERLEALIEGGQ